MHPMYIPPRDPHRGPATTPMAFVRAIAIAYRRYGADPAAALSLAQIAPAMLDDPDARVTAAQMEIFLAVAMQELDDEALGGFSRRLPWGTYGMLCRASITSPNLAVAIRRWCRHHQLLTKDVVMTLSTSRSEAQFAIHEHRDLGELREVCLVTMLRYFMAYACWAIDSLIPLTETRLPYAAPPHEDAYPLMFPGRIEFGAETAAIRFDARYLDLPLRRDDRDLRETLGRALQLTVHQYRRDRLLVARVRHLLTRDPGETMTAEALAERLHVSTRTLHRQLREEGASLQAIKNETRRERAIELLGRTRRPIKQVALAVGFRNEKSFSRAFKEWTGLTPGDYRNVGR